MSLLNRLRPKWQNSDPEVRVEAVRRLDKNDIELLTAVAQGDADTRVRKIAIKKLETPRVLLEIAETDSDEGVRTSALARARHLLVHIACDNRDEDESARALELLTEASDVASVADRARFDAVRSKAFDTLQGDAAWVTLAVTAKNPELKNRALGRIEGPSALKDVVLHESAGELASLALTRIDDIEALEAIAEHGGAPKSIRRQASAKLAKLVPDDHPIRVKQREEQFAELCKQAEALERGAIDELNALESSWADLAALGVVPDDLSARLEQAAARVREPFIAAKAVPREETPEVESAPPSAHLALIERVETLDDVGLEETLRDARDEWAKLEKDTSLERRFNKAVAGAKARIERSEKLEARREELRGLLAHVESVVASDDAEASARELAKLTKKWRTLESVADADAKARYAHLEHRSRELIENKRREQEEQEQKTLTEIQTCMAKLAELTASRDLSIREADKALRAAQNLLKSMGPLARSVNRKKVRRELSDEREKLFKKTQEVRTIEDWKRWANADIQNGLIKRIEALKESKDVPKIAKELRVIHEEWKKAGAAPSEKAEELWNRYKATRDELKVKCDEFFQKQKKERLENLKQKRALCDEVEALADSDDWNKTADAIKALQEKWKTIGPAPQKQSDAVWKRFRKSCDNFFERRKGHFDELKGERNENLKKKEALCERAEAIRESTDWRPTADKLKHLQAEWRTIGAVPKKKSDQVWKRFRKACDYFFDRYNRRDEVEHEERQKQRDALVEQAAQFADALPDDQDAVAAKAKELWSSWKKLGAAPESKRDARERFEAIVSKLVAGAPEAFSDTDLDPTACRKKRERLVTRLESLVGELTAKMTTASEADALEDLAQRLKDALASNTMTGGKPRDKKLDWRAASDEVRKLKANWLRTPPVPGDDGRILGERFETAYQSFLDSKPQ